MKFNTVIIGGGLAGLVAGISLQKEGLSTAIISTGQNALHFFSGSFESLREPSPRIAELFSEAGIGIHYSEGVRLMPLGTFREAALSLDDVSIFPDSHFARKALIVGITGYLDFFGSFLAEGLEKNGIQCRLRNFSLPELDTFRQSSGEMRSFQIARILDRAWESAVREIRVLLKDEDAVILPQVFGFQDISVPGKIRQEIPAKVVFAGTMPPSVPGIRTQRLLKRRYETLGGTYLAGDEAVTAHVHNGTVHSIVTKNLDSHYLEADNFILASGGFFSKGLKSNPFQILEPVFGLDVEFAGDRNDWYDRDFMKDQPYMGYGVRTDSTLRAIAGGGRMDNLFAVGSILGGTRPELGSGAGLAIRSALAAVDEILKTGKK